MKVFFFNDQLQGTLYYRSLVPCYALQSLGHTAWVDNKLDDEHIDDFDIFHFHKPWHYELIGAYKKIKAKGKKIIYDFDDDLFNLHPTNPGYEHWSKPATKEIVKYGMINADALTVSVKPLMKFSQFNKNIQILPNMLFGGTWKVEKKENPKVIIGYAAGVSHYHDLKVGWRAIKQVCEEYDAEYHLCGMNEAPFEQFPQFKIVEPAPFHTFCNDVIGKFDIGLIPLQDNEFNRNKSIIKFLEYTMGRVPTVASKVTPYKEVIEHGKTGFLFRNDKDLLKIMSKLTQSPELRREIVRNARQVVKTEYFANKTPEVIEDVFKNIYL